jgi:hypothetical protein
MRAIKFMIFGVGAGLLLGGCAHEPIAPTVAVIPAPNKPFSVFQQDEASCKRYADQQVAGGAQAANNRAVETGAVATGLGALLGAVVGGGNGAGVGAVTGAVLGTAVGADASQRDQYGLQSRYDIAYSQCMYAKGDQVPGFRSAAAPPPPPPPKR